MPRVSPEDFYSKAPPERIIGSECEYTVQPAFDRAGSPTPISLYCDIKAVESAGYNAALTQIRPTDIRQIFLDNGGKIYPDLGAVVEYSAAESLGPQQATLTDLAGMLVVPAVVKASGFPHRGVFRRTGYAFGDARTTGYHENYLIPYNLTSRNYLYALMPTFLATRVWAWSGAVGDSYELSQKFRDIGDAITDNVENNRIESGCKPMAMIRNSYNDDVDVSTNREWARFEVRFTDAKLSPVATYLGFAATSLTLRLCEHENFVSDKLKSMALTDPVKSLPDIAKDTKLTTTLDVQDNDYVTAIDIQKQFLKDIKHMAQSVQLPKSETMAIPIWEHYLTLLTSVQREEMRLADLQEHMDFAAKLHYLEGSKKIGPENITSESSNALKLDLLWDEILARPIPKNKRDITLLGQRHWQKVRQGKRIPPSLSAERIAYYATEPPRSTRAFHRARTIGSSRLDIQDITWNHCIGYHAFKESRLIKQQWPDFYAGQS